MVMGNLCVHKGERVRQLAENAGFELIYLPPYTKYACIMAHYAKDYKA
jgi:hypothetical protein